MRKYIAILVSNGTENPTVTVLETVNISADALTWERQADGVFVGLSDEDYFNMNQPTQWTLADYDGKSFSVDFLDGAHVEVRGKLPNGDDSDAVFAGEGQIIEIVTY